MIAAADVPTVKAAVVVVVVTTTTISLEGQILQIRLNGIKPVKSLHLEANASSTNTYYKITLIKK